MSVQPGAATLEASCVSAETASSTPRAPWRAAGFLAIACLAFFLLFFNGRLGIIDGELMFQMTESMVERGSVEIQPHRFASKSADGKYYSKYGPLQSILSVPFYVVGREAARHAPASVSSDQIKRAAVALFNPLVLAALAAAVFLLCMELGLPPRHALSAALLSVFGTSLLYLSKTFNSEPLTALTLVLAFTQLVRFKVSGAARHVWLAGLFLAFGVATRQVIILMIAPVAIYCWWVGGRQLRRAVEVVVPVAVMVAVLAFYNFHRFGNPLETGYANERFLTPVWYGVAGLLASPRCGILFYMPLLLLAVPGFRRFQQSHREEAWLIAAISVISLVTSGAWWCWYGGWGVGPRLLLPVAPLLMVVATLGYASLAPRAVPRALLSVLLAANIGIQVVPLLTAHPEWRQIETRTEATGEDPYWNFSLMPLVWQTRNFVAVLQGNPAGPATGNGTTPQVGATEATGGVDLEVDSRFNVPVIDSWASFMLVLGVPRVVPVTGLVLLLSTALLALAASIRATRGLASPDQTGRGLVLDQPQPATHGSLR